MSVQTGAQNLTGIWNGLYAYRDGRSISFVATLIDGGSSLTGTSHEPDSRSSVTLYAKLVGTHQDGAVTFTKSYDQPDRYHRDPIFYSARSIAMGPRSKAAGSSIGWHRANF